MIDQTLRVLEKLVACPTVSADSNLDLIDYASDLLAAHGARITTTTDADGDKANLFATLGPDADGGVVLSGHTDVVPVDGQDWSRDPFRLQLEGRRAYGRGTTDMKGFLACTLAMAPDFAATDLARPIHFAFTYDEEEGCHGARVMLEELAQTGPEPAVALIGEPTGLGVVAAHKGCYEFTTEIHGLERHASMGASGAGAVHAAARFVGYLDALAHELAVRTPVQSLFDPPCSTINVGTITGGVARNITAGSALLHWEMRPVVPGDVSYALERLERFVEDELLPSMRAEFPAASITTTTVGAVGGLLPDPGGPAVELARRLTGQSNPRAVSFGTEAGVYQEYGIAPVVCGPGDLAQAHTPDEYIELNQLEECLAVLHRLLKELQ